MKPKMADVIKQLKFDLELSFNAERNIRDKLEAANKRLMELAAENESLRMDKKWLQAMHSNLLQSIQVSVIKER